MRIVSVWYAGGMRVLGGRRADSLHIYYALFGNFAFANT